MSWRYLAVTYGVGTAVTLVVLVASYLLLAVAPWQAIVVGMLAGGISDLLLVRRWRQR